MQIRVTHMAPANLSYPYVDGPLTYGDTFEVDDAKGEALLDAHDYLEEVIDVDGGEDYGTDDEPPQGLDSLTYDELYERASEYDIDGRSEMDKAELIDALRED